MKLHVFFLAVAAVACEAPRDAQSGTSTGPAANDSVFAAYDAVVRSLSALASENAPNRKDIVLDRSLTNIAPPNQHAVAAPILDPQATIDSLWAERWLADGVIKKICRGPDPSACDYNDAVVFRMTKVSWVAPGRALVQVELGYPSAAALYAVTLQRIGDSWSVAKKELLYVS